MKAHTDFAEVISTAKKMLAEFDDLGMGLYALDGEIPSDDADRAVKDARGFLDAALVLVCWLGFHMRLVWRCGPGHRMAVTATATVVRPLDAGRAEMSPGRRIIRGEVTSRSDEPWQVT